MRALIVEDGYSRGALAAARGLCSEGWTVGVASPRRVGLAASSRSVTSWHRVPPPTLGLDRFVASVNAAAEEGGFELVFGAGDAELLALSAARDRLSPLVPYAPHDVVVRAHDKFSLLDAARAAGLATPRTLPADGEALAGFGTPVAVKARAHARPDGAGRDGRLEALITHDVDEAAKRIYELRTLGAEPLLQEVVRGRLVAHTVVADRGGRVAARLQQEAESTWPPQAGVSVRARTVPVDEELAAGVDRLLTELRWFGLAELQFLAPPAGSPCLIDFNGRFYGSLELALASGLNLPAIWAALAVGTSIPTARTPRVGVRYHWLEGDLRRARADRTGRLGVKLLEVARYARGASDSIWRRDDRRPATRYALHLAGRGLRRLARR